MRSVCSYVLVNRNQWNMPALARNVVLPPGVGAHVKPNRGSQPAGYRAIFCVLNRTPGLSVRPFEIRKSSCTYAPICMLKYRTSGSPMAFVYNDGVPDAYASRFGNVNVPR